MVVGARHEDSNATTINGDETNNDATNSGAAYVYVKSGGVWAPEAYLKASNADAGDRFGINDVTISDDGNTIAIGTGNEDSNVTGVSTTASSDNTGTSSGAVYIFSRTGSSWTQEAYIKATNTGISDRFANVTLDLSNDGNTLVVGAGSEDSDATTVNGDQFNDLSSNSGAVYVYNRSGSTWSSTAYLKAVNNGSSDTFGSDVVISGDGTTIAVAAENEGSNATTINGDGSNDLNNTSGAAYIFTLSGGVWSQEAYIKASNNDASDFFGTALDLSNDGNVLVVSALREDSTATGVSTTASADNSGDETGAVYAFSRSGSTWTQDAYIKAPNPNDYDKFGDQLALSADGNVLAISTWGEDSNAQTINGDQSDNTASDSGAVYIYTRGGTVWAYQSYIKASNADSFDSLEYVSLNSDGTTLAAGSHFEQSNATGVTTASADNSLFAPGAVYIFNITF